jgi:hypothetical protein
MQNENKMDIEIDKDIKKSTTKCEKGLKCLVDNTYELCKVTESVRDKVLFVECLEENICSYKMGYGYANICNCPVRKEIYKKYKI